jgi:cellulose synthase/poly-beta-1,6-N-acetylglucosamine synthase-like glycosyltransferase
MPTPTLSVVVPLYNEQDNVAQLQREIHTALAGIDYELVLVDDGGGRALPHAAEVGPYVAPRLRLAWVVRFECLVRHLPQRGAARGVEAMGPLRPVLLPVPTPMEVLER